MKSGLDPAESVAPMRPDLHLRRRMCTNPIPQRCFCKRPGCNTLTPQQNKEDIIQSVLEGDWTLAIHLMLKSYTSDWG